VVEGVGETFSEDRIVKKLEFEQNTYEGRSAEWLINRVIAECKWHPNNLGVVSENPEPDGKSVRVWEDDIGYCGPEIGVFDYTGNLELAPPEAVPIIFGISARLDIPLGDMALVLRNVLHPVTHAVSS
jgi:hypothetical protein